MKVNNLILQKKDMKMYEIGFQLMFLFMALKSQRFIGMYGIYSCWNVGKYFFVTDDMYDYLKINLNNETLLPINKQSELDLLENMKVYFDDIYFNAFYHIKTNDNIKDKKKLLLCLMKKYFNNEKNIIQRNVKTEKNNDKNLKLLFICMLSITLIRFLFTKYFLVYSSSVIGICSLTLISIIAFITYEKYLMSTFERKEYGKN